MVHISSHLDRFRPSRPVEAHSHFFTCLPTDFVIFAARSIVFLRYSSALEPLLRVLLLLLLSSFTASFELSKNLPSSGHSND